MENNTPETQPTPVAAPAPVAPIAPVAAPVAPAVAAAQGGKGLNITSMVLGIVSLPIFWIWFVSIPVAIVAVVLGIVALVKKQPGKGMGIAGVITGGVTLLAIVALILFVAIFAAAAGYNYNSNQVFEMN